MRQGTLAVPVCIYGYMLFKLEKALRLIEPHAVVKTREPT